MQNNIAVVGSKTQVLLLKTLGFDAITPKKENLRATFAGVVKDYKVIFIFSSYAKLVEDIISSTFENTYPAITILPEDSYDNQPLSYLQNQIEKTIGGGVKLDG